MQEIGEPEKINPPDGIGKEFADGECPCLLIAQQFAPAYLSFRFIGPIRLIFIAQDVIQLRLLQSLLPRWYFIKDQPQNQPYKPDRAGNDKGPVPSPGYSDKRYG